MDTSVTAAAISAAAVIAGAVVAGFVTNDLDRIERQQRILKGLATDSVEATQMSEAMSKAIERHHDRVTNRIGRLRDYISVVALIVATVVSYRLLGQLGEPDGLPEQIAFWALYAIGILSMGLAGYSTALIVRNR